MLQETMEDLEGNYPVQRSRIINHPAYSKPVLMTQYGWAKRGKETVWIKDVKIEEIKENERPN